MRVARDLRTGIWCRNGVVGSRMTGPVSQKLESKVLDSMVFTGVNEDDMGNVGE